MTANLLKTAKVEKQERFQGNNNKSYYEKALQDVIQQVERNLALFTEQFPSAHSVGLQYQPVKNADLAYYSDWTSSFWTGMVWLAYELTVEDKYAEVAQKHVDSFQERLVTRDILNHHDIGFLYSLSCVAGYKLAKDEKSKHIALDAAKLLAMRFREKSGIIQVRGYLEDDTHKEKGVFIVDCAMNVPLLFWAAEVTGDQTYYVKAKRHMDNVARHMIREDGAIYQMFRLDIETGEALGGWTGQGYADEACWSRGQAWAMYGLPLAYRYTKDMAYIEQAKAAANYFLNHLPEDLICNWDLVFLQQDGQRDTSAAAIAACGLLELSYHLPVLDRDRQLYEEAALAILTSLTENYVIKERQEGTGILAHGVYSLPIDLGVDECTIWGDYFYMEALIRVQKDWNPYW